MLLALKTPSILKLKWNKAKKPAIILNHSSLFKEKKKADFLIVNKEKKINGF